MNAAIIPPVKLSNPEMPKGFISVIEIARPINERLYVIRFGNMKVFKSVKNKTTSENKKKLIRTKFSKLSA